MTKQFFSIGTDIVEVRRIEKLARNKKFLHRIFTDEEIRYCRNKKNGAQHYAVRFAAKEAVWKALGNTLSGRGISHKEISIRRAPSGKPLVVLSKFLKKYENNISLSLTHTKEYAVAVALFQSHQSCRI